jgi:hypothetical protein
MKFPYCILIKKKVQYEEIGNETLVARVEWGRERRGHKFQICLINKSRDLMYNMKTIVNKIILY